MLLALLGGLGACANPPDKPPASELTGGLLVIRWESSMEPPPSIALGVASPGKSGVLPFVGKLRQSPSGQVADYLFALALVPDQYLLKALQAPGLLAAGDVPLNLAFAVGEGSPGYLGRLVLTVDAGFAQSPQPPQTRLRVEDHFVEDTALFRAALNELKDLQIGNAVINAGPEILPPPVPAEATSAASEKPPTAPTPVTSKSASLLVRGDRPAFSKFLELPSPRAFATNHAGARSTASGPTAAERALSRCNRRARGGECQLFAVDDLLVNPDACTDQAPGKARPVPCEPFGSGTERPNGPANVVTPTPTPPAPARAPQSTAPSDTKGDPGLEHLLRAGSQK